MPTFSPARAMIVLVVVATALVAMTGRVAYLETYGRQKYIRSAERQQHRNETILARRGSIFSSDGNALALTVQTMNAYIDPEFLIEGYQREAEAYQREIATNQRKGKKPRSMEEDLRRLAELLDYDPAKLQQLIKDKSDSQYVKLTENVSERVAQEIRKLNIPGVGMEPAGTRYYPMGSLASHAMGMVGREGHGLEGLELKFDKELAGKNGWRRVEKDSKARPISVDAGDYVPPAHGQHLVLTIDANIQMIAEQELTTICNGFQAKRGEVVVMDPKTGDVLAMANWPTFNAQNLEDSPPEVRRNRCVTDPYEPGSTLKPFIMGPALAWGMTRPEEVWSVPSPYITPYGRAIKDVHGSGRLTSWDIIVKSSNVGMSRLAERMGNAKLHEALTMFRFGRTTGIELPGEDPGLVYPLKKWGRASTESVAQGYEMMLTPLQIARAFCVYANGGHVIKPRIIKGVLDADGTVISRQQPVKLQ
ncbi:MAG: peptidoglycan D,D-transpeptidase FtsI family protein, partial [Bacillota bacterium]